MPRANRSCPADQSCDEGDAEQDNGNPEKQPRTFHGGSRDAAKAQESRYKCNNQEYDCVVQKVAHDHFSL